MINRTLSFTALLFAFALSTPALAQSKGQAVNADGKLTTTLGVTGDNEASLDGIIAVINNDIITRSELERQLATIERQMVRKGASLPPRSALRQQVLDRMVLDKVQMQRARELGIVMDDRQVDEAMNRVAAQNNLPLDQFLDELRKDGIPPARFRQEVETEMTIAALRDREVNSRIQVSESEIEAYLASQTKGKVSLEPQVNWIQILVKVAADASDKDKKAAAKRADNIESALENNLSVDEIYANNADLKMDGTGQMGWQGYNQVPSLFTSFLSNSAIDAVTTIQSPNGYHVLKVIGRRQGGLSDSDSTPITQTRARHILIRVSPDIDESEAQRRLNFALEQLREGGADFETLAKRYSQDGSASKGGDLGWLYPGDTVPEFEAVMNRLQPGEVSNVFQSRFGFHIIQVLERRQQAVSGERQKLAARQAIRSSKAEEAYREWLRQLRDRTFVDIRL